MESFLEKNTRQPVDFRKCKYVLAPMVDFSELPFRLLCRRYGAQLCYTPMINAGQFVKSATLRAQEMQTCAADQPLMVQFCANDAATFASAAQYVAPYCDAVDLNLGCPQQVARRGHYGAFLTEWNIIDDMIRTARRSADVPITCKIRLLDSVERTIEYAQMLVHSGVSAIALHGRTRDQIRDHAGAANWDAVRTVIDAVGNQVPMFANGSIRTLQDADRCMERTGACGVLIAESTLLNPALFAGDAAKAPYEIASEYLDAVTATWDVQGSGDGEEDGDGTAIEAQSNQVGQTPVVAEWSVKRKWNWSKNIVRGHLFKMLHFVCAVDTEVRERISRAHTFADFREAVRCARERCERDAAAYALGLLNEANVDSNFVPYWTSRSYFLPDEPLPAYFRRSQNKHLKAELGVIASSNGAQVDHTGDMASKLANALEVAQAAGRAPDDPLLQNVANALKRKAEKLGKREQRKLDKAARVPRMIQDCVECRKPRSLHCTNLRCRKCCHRLVISLRNEATATPAISQTCQGQGDTESAQTAAVTCKSSLLLGASRKDLPPNCENHRHFVNADWGVALAIQRKKSEHDAQTS